MTVQFPTTRDPGGASTLPLVPSIMLVEDDADIREVIAEVLRDAGFEVAVACNGEEALNMLAVLRPKLVLLDWAMPKVSGEQVLATLRADASLSQIPVVVLTASHRRQVAHTGTKVLQKPVELAELIEVVQDHCQRAS